MTTRIHHRGHGGCEERSCVPSMVSVVKPFSNRIRQSVLTNFAMALGLTLVTAFGCWAQSYRGAIRGVLHDSSGAVLPHAAVTARNTATGESRSVTTGDDGAYVIPELTAGEYEVTAAAPGFKHHFSVRARVEVGVDTNLDLTIFPTSSDIRVEVVAAVPLVNTASATLGQIVENRLVIELPLNGRDFGKLVALTPGVTVEGSGVAGSEKGFGQFNINGARDRSNNYMLDGTDNNDPFFNNSALNQVGITGAPASLLPIDAIQEFNLETQFGAEYGRNSGAAVNVLTKSGTNQFHGSAFEYVRNDLFDARNFFAVNKSEFRNNQFGGSLGGPIQRDKTFFFTAYEGQRERVGSDFDLLVPSAQAISQAQSIALANGISAINPALNKLLDFFPTPSSVDPSSLVGSAPSSVRDMNDLDSFLVKLDHQISPAEQVSGRYVISTSQQDYPLGSVGGFGSGSRLQQFEQVSPTRVQVVSLSLLSTPSATKVNEVRFGYSRYRTSFNSADANLDSASIGLDTGTGINGLPEVDFGGIFDNLGATVFGIPRGRVSQTDQILDNFTWLRGEHTVKFGGQFWRADIASSNDNYARGIISINLDPYSSPAIPSPVPAVDLLANLFLGDAYTEAYTGDTERHTYNNNLSFFAQDDYRARPNLTLNLGLRWEYFGPLSEAQNRISNLASDGTLELVGTDGLNGAYQRDLRNFAPRLGLAWNPVRNTVMRAGYGIYYDYIPQDILVANYTNSAGITLNPIGPDAVVPLDTANSSAALNGSMPGPIFGGPLTGPPYNVLVTDRDLKTPYGQNWSLNVEQALGHAASLEVGYVGSKGTHLTRLYDLNQPDPVTGNYPNPNFYSEDVLSTGAGSNYDGLQVITRIRSWHGLGGFTAYTWSKSLDDASDGIDFNFASAAFPQNSQDLRAEYGPSTFDTRNRYTAALNYQLPVRTHAHPRLGQGWQLNSIITLQSGRPIPILTADDTTNTFESHQRPNLVQGVPVVLPNWDPSTGYLNPNAFAQPAEGTFGDLGRNAIFGPSFANVDFSISKTTRLNEKLGLQIRWEIFNILNRANFALPNGTLTPGVNADGTVNAQAGQAGLITQTPDVAQGNPGLGGGGPRVMQVAARLMF
jgi:hypothetical protein